MRLLLVQLSDIHLYASENIILDRRDKIVSAIQGAAQEVSGCVLLFTGDVAQSGADEEYAVALDLIEPLCAGLRRALTDPAPVELVVIPGNHDCDLRADQSARDVMRDSLVANNPTSVGNAVADVCTSVQKAFFDLRDLVSSTPRMPGKLYYDYHFTFGGTRVEVRCLNTAWLSQLHEREGTLYFPAALVPKRDANSALSITLLHHPFSWFESGNRRELQARIEGVSDIIFTGHEHAHTRRTQEVSTGETNEFIEGVALQVRDDPLESGFNIVLIDTDAKKQDFMRYEWDDANAMYICETRSDWQPFQVNRLRARKDFELLPEFARHLEDPGAALEKRGRGPVKLSDIYVFPELRHITHKLGATDTVVRGEQVFDEPVAHRGYLITGAEQSGKTSLAKQLFLKYLNDGYVPILLDGETFSTQSGERFVEAFVRAFEKQYNSLGSEKYRQLEPARRVIIVDNLHKLRVKPGALPAILNGIDAYARRAVFITNDLAHAFGEIVRAGDAIEERDNYEHYRLLPFGHVKRSDLTTKWLLLDGELSEEQLAREIKRGEETMAVVLGRNYVPAFPVFILSMLQGLDAAQQVDVGASTYGYFYELLIKSSLARGSDKVQFNIKISYLTFVAYAFFTSGRKELTDGELRKISAEFERTYDIVVDHETMVDELVRRLIFVRFSDTYEFKYSYIYYYFVASHIAAQITTEPIRQVVRRLSGQITDEESANILLFLAHLSNDPLIIDEMLAKARSEFAESAPATLERGTAFLTKLAGAAAPEFEYDGLPVEEKRRQELEYRDSVERTDAAEETTTAITDPKLDAQQQESQALIGRMLEALKTLQILGQVLKNFPGSIVAERKEAIAKECYLVGFRVLESVLRFVDEGKEELITHVIATLRERRPNAKAEVLTQRANAVVFGLALVASYGIVKRISVAVGSPELGPTYEKVLATIASPAARLVNMSIQLDQSTGFPRGEIIRLGEELEQNNLPLATLKWLVLSHINLFPVGYKDRQKVCDALKIKFSSLAGANPKRRLLGPKTTS